MQFVAFDIETANPDYASICQLGAVVFDRGAIVEAWETLVDPETWFDPNNVAIHGIDARRVQGSPRFPEVFEELRRLLGGRSVIHHTGFDPASLKQAVARHDLVKIDCRWLDTAKVVRRAWPEFARSGYGLANVARRFGIAFRHHSACEDARAAGEILLRAVDQTGLDLDGWHDRIRRPIHAPATRA